MLMSVALTMMLATGGCEGKISQDATSQDDGMIIGEVYTVYPGDTLINDDGGQIEIIHTASDNVKRIRLLSGSAHLVRAQ